MAKTVTKEEIRARRSERVVQRPSDAVMDYVHRVFRENKTDLSAAHNFGHVSRVANGAYAIVKAVGGTEQQAEAARAGGYLHDLIRSRSELVDDETASAQKATPMLEQLVKVGKFNDAEMNAILASIKTANVPKEL